MMENTREDELEIDLKQIFYVLKEKNINYFGRRTFVWLYCCVATKLFDYSHVHFHIEYATFD